MVDVSAPSPPPIGNAIVLLTPAADVNVAVDRVEFVAAAIGTLLIAFDVTFSQQTTLKTLIKIYTTTKLTKLLCFKLTARTFNRMIFEFSVPSVFSVINY